MPIVDICVWIFAGICAILVAIILKDDNGKPPRWWQQ